MRIWVDDTRPMPADFDYKISTVEGGIELIKTYWNQITHISLDHDAGDFVEFGGDYIEILKWLEELQYTEDKIPPFTFTVHSGNPVGVRNMKAIIEHCGWTYVNHWDEEECDVII